jgi:2-C-methyl-D-erythritol 4-phosphate cytidylyltransferase/2-C-methyl-D-erythritol 2,4-cyclodiphosphate synthase
MRVSALLMAAGRGARFGADMPKQYLPLLGRPVLRHAAEALLRDGLVDRILPVCAAGEEARISSLLGGLPALPPVPGGDTRQDSVRAGLEALAAAAPPPDAVLVHDAARPVVPAGTVARLLAAWKQRPAPYRPRR